MFSYWRECIDFCVLIRANSATILFQSKRNLYDSQKWRKNCQNFLWNHQSFKRPSSKKWVAIWRNSIKNIKSQKRTTKRYSKKSWRRFVKIRTNLNVLFAFVPFENFAIFMYKKPDCKLKKIVCSLTMLRELKPSNGWLVFTRMFTLGTLWRLKKRSRYSPFDNAKLMSFYVREQIIST